MKKKAVVGTGLFLAVILLFALIGGKIMQYIPFTEESAIRRYRKAYESCKGDFTALQKELTEICIEIQEHYKDKVSYSAIDFSNVNRDEEWSISLKQDHGWEPVPSMTLGSRDEIFNINRRFGEDLMFIVYRTNEYVQYNIGEYCTIRIPVKSGKVLINGR